ncbi:ComE operon protein 2 [Virgibacillus sp. 179-BFC.A HS]|uniref:ComE operon protein 2 n=1 Tax=Tigheibacillus jepli TaxID=3035914 RepID=A0ABU5CH27_9BACI|nr:ComE operon protein 2 [Virgibacillus sp. 179-BFC.A HS]MDY0405515.1 ComE operon protein 2 [Virgibacillus sp. 179-BFC.A HS]
MERISWDQYFMAQSHLLALRSTCTRLMVGATIVREKESSPEATMAAYREVCTVSMMGCYVVDGHCVRTVHAEANALLQCAKFGVPTENADLYVTHFPCLQCCKQIIQSGIKNVYYAQDYHNHPYAIQLYEEAGVNVKKVNLDYLAVDTHYKEKQNYVWEILGKLAPALDEEEFEALKSKGQALFSAIK